MQTRFGDAERQLLLVQTGLGPTVIERIEAAGFVTLESLRLAGVDQVVGAVCARLGSTAWANRRRALQRALACAAAAA